MGGAGRSRRVQARPAAVTREQVYGRRPVHEALRGPREVLELWATERAVAAEPWLQDGVRVHVKPDRDVSEAAGTRDHQGVLAWCEPYRYADAYELAAHDRPLLACLDQVTDPRNLGAVLRSAEGRRRDGCGRARARRCAGHAGCLPGLGGGGRASSRSGRAEPRPLPERDQARPTSGSTLRLRRPSRTCGRRTCPGVWPSCSARRARACGRSCGAPAMRRSRSRSRGG